MDSLTERQKQILEIAIREYITTAHPIGSDTVCRKHTLGISPATIRNEFAALTDMGYLMQPHTSAGRVPTAEGYRYFVQQLMEESELPLSQQLLIRHQFHQITKDPDEWLKLAASVLAHVAQSAALISAPQTRRARFRHMELVSISDRTGLTILVLQDGSVHQQLMSFARSVSQEELSRLSARLNERYANMSAEEMRSAATGLEADLRESLEPEVTQHIIELTAAHEATSGRQIYRDGLMQVLHQPEFEEIDRARDMLQFLEQGDVLESMLRQVQLDKGVQVIIGSEGKWEAIRDFSMVLSGYGLPGEAKGVLGVLGPMRMPYGLAIPAVRYVATLMSDLVNRLYGEQMESDRNES